MSIRPDHRSWFWAAVVLTALKLWLVDSQTIFAIGPAIHDDRLFVELAANLIKGDWLGSYNQFTLAKGPMFPLFIAAAFWLGVPLMLAQQLLYAAASATLTYSLFPWLRHGAARFGLYAVLLWNPMSYDAGNLSRLMRQNLYTPLALFTIAGLVMLVARRYEAWPRQLWPATLAGLSFGAFWLTREESVWLLPAVTLLLLGPIISLRREWLQRWRPVALGLGVFTGAALLPSLTISTLNWQHYGWFGTVEFRAKEFKAAYGALTRPLVGPELDQVPVTRQMREALYGLSPAFARLKPHLEGPVGDHWSDKDHFPAADRQMRGGWFVWAIRDASNAAGLAPDARTAMQHYQQIADEVNSACDAGLVPARPPRHGFVPPITGGLVRPILLGAIEYTGYFLGFQGFTAYSPDSIGDYAELKSFRDYVGTTLSHAPRSPEPPAPERSARNQRKLQALERIGLGFGHIISWLGPFLLLVGAVRGIESLIDRRLSLPLGLAAALLSACGAYLAINILVQVTSFHNMSPAALASAYPLYLIALGAIATDAIRAWRKVTLNAIEPPGSTHASRWSWLAPIGVACVVFAARLGEIHGYASDVPHNEQWYVEARDILAPWLHGTLGLRDFFIPHLEHVPVWTRLLVWLQVVVSGRWDPLVQMTVNAILHTGFIWLVARWSFQTLRPTSAAVLAVVLMLGGSLPHAWENITWGFQSQFPLALVLLWLHVHGACTHTPGCKAWWFAQLAALAGLFTLAGMWLSPFAVLASWLWTGSRHPRRQWVPWMIAVLGAAMLMLTQSRIEGSSSFAQFVQSPLAFLHACLHLLGWPSMLPGAVAIIQLPWLIHALRLRSRGEVAPVDRIIFSLGLWSFAQALLLAFTRTGDTGVFISRHGDLLFVGVLAGALALTRLMPRTGRIRSLYLALVVVWSGLGFTGLVRNSTEGHADYFHQHAAHNADFRRTAVQQYLTSGDRSMLESTTARWALAENPDLVAEMLDQSDFRALLPASVNPQSTPDTVGSFVRWLQAHWWWLLGGGFAATAIGFGLLIRQRHSPAWVPPLVPVTGPWLWRISAAVAGLAVALMFTWSNPLAFNQEIRWQRMLGGDRAVPGMSFDFVGPSEYGSDRLQGAAPILPEVLRNQFFGTAPAGPELTCTVDSSPFNLTTPWLIVPYAGYPVGNGNGLRLRILDEQGQAVGDEIGCPGPNLEGIGYWVVDVRNHPGRSAILVLYDGRTDTEAWVAVAPPIRTPDPAFAEVLAQGLANEKHAGTHRGLAIIALIAALCAAGSWPGRWGRRLESPKP
jgi:hypothetical protein